MRRARTWAGVNFNDPHDRIDAAMVRVLFLGASALVVIGVGDVLARRSLDAAVLPIGAGLMALVAHRMNAAGRARPRTILVGAAILAVAYVGLTAWEQDVVQLRNESGMVIVVSSGVLAVALGGTRDTIARWFWLAAASSIVVLKQGFTSDASVASIVFDVATVVVVVWMAFVTVVEVRNAAQQGQQKYRDLVDFAPVGVAEIDFRDLKSWILRQGFSALPKIDAAIERNIVAPGDVLERISVVVLNEHARTILDVPADADVRDLRLHDILHGGDRKATARWATAIAFGMSEGSVELDFPSLRGVSRSYVVRWNAQSRDLRDVVFTIVDFTAQKRAETALAEQIRSKDQFIASVSHELRTPLTAVVGLVDELANPESSIQEAGERQELLEIVAAQSRDVAYIVEDLLVAARAAGGSLSTFSEHFDLAIAVREVLQVTHADIDVDMPREVAVYADPGRTRQIIRNLVTNALRYGSDPLRLSVTAMDGRVAVEMRDAGEPISPDKRVSMFRPYERAHEASESNPESVGLGLSVSQTLARYMGGDLEYEHDGTESVFRLTLPDCAPEQGSVSDSEDATTGESDLQSAASRAAAADPRSAVRPAMATAATSDPTRLPTDQDDGRGGVDT